MATTQFLSRSRSWQNILRLLDNLKECPGAWGRNEAVRGYRVYPRATAAKKEQSVMWVQSLAYFLGTCAQALFWWKRAWMVCSSLERSLERSGAKDRVPWLPGRFWRPPCRALLSWWTRATQGSGIHLEPKTYKLMRVVHLMHSMEYPWFYQAVQRSTRMVVGAYLSLVLNKHENCRNLYLIILRILCFDTATKHLLNASFCKHLKKQVCHFVACPHRPSPRVVSEALGKSLSDLQKKKRPGTEASQVWELPSFFWTYEDYKQTGKPWHLFWPIANPLQPKRNIA